LLDQAEESPSAVAAGDANQEPEQSAEVLKESIRLAEVCSKYRVALGRS